MSRPPSVSQLLKRAGLAKRPRIGRESSSLGGVTGSGGISTKPIKGLKRKMTPLEGKETTTLVEEAPKDGDVDDKIAALERELEEGSDSGSESSTSDAGDNGGGESSRGENEGSVSGVSKLISPLDAEKIEPLPEHLLPHPGCGVPKSKSRKTKVAQAGPRPSSGLDDAVKELLANYEARSSERVPFYCRVCKFQGDSLEALKKHREGPLHLEVTKKERKLSKCSLCKKQFTSPPQLQEHLSGRAHLEKLQATMSRQGKIVPGRGQGGEHWRGRGGRTANGRGGGRARRGHYR